jgi:hypothetical protein
MRAIVFAASLAAILGTMAMTAPESMAARRHGFQGHHGFSIPWGLISGLQGAFGGGFGGFGGFSGFGGYGGGGHLSGGGRAAAQAAGH